MDYMQTVEALKTEKLFTIPPSEHIDFLKLPSAEQRRIWDLFSIFKTVAAASNKGEAIAACAAVRSGRGFSASSIDKLYRRYTEARSWRVLTRKYRGPRKGQPQAFVKFLISRVCEYRGRTDVVGALTDHIINDWWFAGREVPGYGTFKNWWDCAHPGQPYPRKLDMRYHTPVGWSRRNLSDIVKKYAPRNSELRLAQAYGDLKSHDAQMQLLRDRSNLKPLQLVTFDDVILDIELLFNHNGKWQFCTAQAVFCMDVASGLFLDYGVRPLWNDGEKNRSLTRAEVNAILCNVIHKYGLPANYPMRLLLENASGTLRTADREMMEILLPGRITIENTRMSSKLDFAKFGIMDKHGFPYQKGWLESSFEGLHTRVANLLGATGPRFDDRHNLHKFEREIFTKVLETGLTKGVSPEQLKFPRLTLDEFYPIFGRIVEAYNCRTLHRLQGFDYVFETMLPSGEVVRREELPEGMSSAELRALEFSRRLESPRERWTKLRARSEFTPIPYAALYPLMQEAKRKVTVRNGQISADFTSMSADKLYFRSSALAQLEGREFWAILAQDMSAIYLFNAQNGFVCEVPRLGLVDITDDKAILEQAGHVERERNKARNTLAEFLADRANTYKEIRVHNQTVLDAAQDAGTAMRKKSAAAERKQLESYDPQDMALVACDNAPSGAEEFDPEDML